MYKRITEKIGMSFEQYRKLANLSMRDIYKDEKISIAIISDMENGKKLPRVETLITLMQKVNMPLNEVFSQKVLPPDSRAIIFGAPLKLNWQQIIRKDLIESKFTSNEIEEILRYIGYIKNNRFKDDKQ